MNQEFYQALYQTSVMKLEEKKKQFHLYAVYRGCAAFAFIGCLIAGYTLQQVLYNLPAAVFLLLFILLVRQHTKIVREQQYHTELKHVAEDYLARFGEDWKKFPLTGSPYLTEDFPEAKDLDIFGTSSLYQYLCTASTPFGQDILASWLSTGFSDTDTIKQRQAAVRELSQKPDFTSAYEAVARPEREQEFTASRVVLKEFLDHIHAEEQRPFLLRLLIWVMPVATVAFLALALLDVNRNFYMACFSALACVQFLLALACFSWNSRLLSPVYNFNKRAAPYRTLLGLLKQERFESKHLTELQERILQNGDAAAALKELEDISEAISSRRNLIAFVVYNTLFLHDFHCAQRYLSWRAKNRSRMELWFQTAGELEALISLSVPGQVKETCSIPRIENSSLPFLSAQDLKHPLLFEKTAVGNDISLKHRIGIITGSNMSGKTTLLRSIGVNLILAYAGGFTTAAEFTATPMRLYSSMRVEDSVSQGISTFYAELLRIKKMIDFTQTAAPMIAFIDEIYKGTNSKDRIIGARETIKRLARPHVLTLFTTHDFELCDLEQSVDAENFHFSEYYSENKIHFDYKIKPGRCQTTNAQHLLRMVGILE